MQRPGAKTTAQELGPDSNYGTPQNQAKQVKRTKFDKTLLKRVASPGSKEKSPPVLE
jgi:hypothetical protein